MRVVEWLNYIATYLRLRLAHFDKDQARVLARIIAFRAYKEVV